MAHGSRSTLASAVAHDSLDPPLTLKTGNAGKKEHQFRNETEIRKWNNNERNSSKETNLASSYFLTSIVYTMKRTIFCTSNDSIIWNNNPSRNRKHQSYIRQTHNHT